LFAASQQKTGKDWTEAALRRNPELLDPAMMSVFQMEDVATQECGPPPSGPDHILVLIARTREAANP
jgi:hypothetical protein